ncbi:YdcF family protein [Bifidobacterium pseudocatenulatum]|nr:YdcF family protein [Bifidobacterium pseudocatenulatum]
MANYLESYGIKKNRIIKEMKSKTTQENISNSRALITKPMPRSAS